ncbi:hypothetical protein ACHAXS_001754, partial [Conticribra weissflogii]
MRRPGLAHVVLVTIASINTKFSQAGVVAFSSSQFLSDESRVSPFGSAAIRSPIVTSMTNGNKDGSQYSNQPKHKSRRFPAPNSRLHGKKRAIIKKYGKAIAISTSLLYGPMATTPFLRRSYGGTTAHAASSLAPSKSGPYNFQDFKDVKKKLSLAPGAGVDEYTNILAKVEVEGEEALKEIRKNQKEAALTIGGSGSSGDENSALDIKKSKIREGKKAKKGQEISDWESDEFGFGDENDDDDDEFLSFGNSGTSSVKLGPSKRKGSLTSSGSGEGEEEVVITDKMAYNKYKAPDTKDMKIRKLKKGAFYTLLPVFIITTIRGTVRTY